jgi:hypothetical protein
LPFLVFHFFGLLAGSTLPFPYGLYKAETVATLVTSVAVIVAGYEIARRAILGPDKLPEVTVALPVAVASLLITLAFTSFALENGCIPSPLRLMLGAILPTGSPRPWSL